MTYESIAAWIDRQPWSDDVKAEAHTIHNDRVRLNLNPMTGSQWAAWADAKGVEIALVTR